MVCVYYYYYYYQLNRYSVGWNSQAAFSYVWYYTMVSMVTSVWYYTMVSIVTSVWYYIMVSSVWYYTMVSMLTSVWQYTMVSMVTSVQPGGFKKAKHVEETNVRTHIREPVDYLNFEKLK